MASTVGSRLAYDKAKEAINRAGFSLGQAVLSQSYLRLETTLQTSKTLYQFPILQNDNSNGAQFKTEQRLKLQDAFYCSSYAIFFTKNVAVDAGAYKLYTYPDPTDLTNAADLYSFYNGYMSLTVNNRQIVPAIDLLRNEWVGQTQTSATTINQFDGSSSAFYPIEPGWVLVGSKNNSLQINIPSALTAVMENQRAVLVFRGHLGQNITPVR